MLTIKELYILPSLKYRIDGGHLRAENVFHHSESMKTITSRNHIQVVNVGLHVSKTYIVQHQHNPPPQNTEKMFLNLEPMIGEFQTVTVK